MKEWLLNIFFFRKIITHQKSTLKKLTEKKRAHDGVKMDTPNKKIKHLNSNCIIECDKKFQNFLQDIKIRYRIFWNHDRFTPPNSDRFTHKDIFYKMFQIKRFKNGKISRFSLKLLIGIYPKWIRVLQSTSQFLYPQESSFKKRLFLIKI